ncbi:Holliday junction resolvase RecU [Thomasclavelia cocleata]|uniref:Holliday junction resolvase RecU n=1 Tax=Thomasclavelia cocleata TaxID=69824 RepID=UPI00242B8A27|nr:Holliday junction resolvase RecU [Thomasclavelia cocleata]
MVQDVRGKQLEKQIDHLIKWIDSIGYHGHKNHPKRLNDGKYIEGEPFDFEIFTPSYKCCFDTKECKSNRWSLENAKPHQVDYLKKCKNCGLDAFFLVYFFNYKRLVKFDVDLIIECLSNDVSSLGVDDGKEWKEIYDIKNKGKY